MKSESNQETSAPRRNLWALGVVFVLCLGLGVTGTLLWAENRPQVSIAATSGAKIAALPARPEAAPEVAREVERIVGVPGVRVPTGAQEHLPPVGLTQGMSARQASLTLANWYYDHHQHELAVKSFRRAIALGVTHPNVRTDLGNALRLNGQPQEALRQYQLAQKQDPTHEQSLFNQGALYAVSLQNRMRAVEVWRLYVQRFPQGANVARARQLLAKYGAK